MPRSDSIASDDPTAALLPADAAHPIVGNRCRVHRFKPNGAVAARHDGRIDQAEVFSSPSCDSVPLSALLTARTSSPPPQAVTLTWQDIQFAVPTADKSERPILRGISGYVQGGHMLAILGPSGSGKTTLLNLLAQRRANGRMTGEICLNGQPLSEGALRSVACYVQQEDALHSYLTVRETICFAAQLRTPSTTTTEEAEECCDRVMQLLGINHIRGQLIGNELVRGISGGEKKRCSIALELVASPSIIFLDEPTTGLDTFTALHLLTILKALSQIGVAVVFSIHQPRHSIFRMFDQVLLLNSKGEEAYFGPAEQAMPFLEEIGVRCDYPENPADFLLDSVSELGVGEQELLLQTTVRGPGCPIEGEALSNLVPSLARGEDIAASFRCTLLPRIQYELRQLNLVSAYDGPSLGTVTPACRRHLLVQTTLIASRYFRNKVRDPIATYVSVTVALIFGVLIGTMYYQVGLTQASIRNRMGVLFFLIMNTTFSSLGSLGVFLSDRSIYRREYESGTYHPAAYYIGKAIPDVPMGIVVNLAFNIIVYPLVGLQRTWEKFLIFCCICLLVMLNSYTMCIFISNISKNYAVANLLAPLLLVLYLLPSGGILISLDSVPLCWRWIKYISFVRYGFAALAANEFDGLVFECDASLVNSTGIPCIRSGTVYAVSQGFFISDLPSDIAVLAASMAAYFVLGFIALYCIRHDGR